MVLRFFIYILVDLYIFYLSCFQMTTNISSDPEAKYSPSIFDHLTHNIDPKKTEDFKNKKEQKRILKLGNSNKKEIKKIENRKEMMKRIKYIYIPVCNDNVDNNLSTDESISFFSSKIGSTFQIFTLKYRWFYFLFFWLIEKKNKKDYLEF